MASPIPKDPAIRQRRNQRSTRATLPAEAETRRKRVPQLPKRAGEWHPMTRQWWRDVWRSPMSVEYLTADHHGLFRLAVLIDEFWIRPTKELAGEIRLQQQNYGLSPLDRRRLEWTVEKAEQEKARRQKPQPPKREPSGEDPRRMLEIVS